MTVIILVLISFLAVCGWAFAGYLAISCKKALAGWDDSRRVAKEAMEGWQREKDISAAALEELDNAESIFAKALRLRSDA